MGTETYRRPEDARDELDDTAPENEEGGREAVGAGAGALGGAAVGMAVGGPPGAVVGGVIGAAGGAIAGEATEGDDEAGAGRQAPRAVPSLEQPSVACSVALRVRSLVAPSARVPVPGRATRPKRRPRSADRTQRTNEETPPPEWRRGLFHAGKEAPPVPHGRAGADSEGPDSVTAGGGSRGSR